MECARDLRLLYHLDYRLDGDTRQMPLDASVIGAFLVIIPYLLRRYGMWRWMPLRSRSGRYNVYRHYTIWA